MQNEGANEAPPSCLIAHDLLLALQLVCKSVGAVEFAKTLDHAGRMHSDGAILGAVIDEVASHGLDVAVEDKADEFAIAVDDGRAGVAANDVSGTHKIQRRVEVQFPKGGLLFRSQVEGWLVAEACGAIVEPVERSEGRSDGAIVGIALDRAIAQAERERGVRIGILAIHKEAGLAKLFTGRRKYARDGVA